MPPLNHTRIGVRKIYVNIKTPKYIFSKKVILFITGTHEHGNVADPSGPIDRYVHIVANCKDLEVPCKSNADCADCEVDELFCSADAQSQRKCIQNWNDTPS